MMERREAIRKRCFGACLDAYPSAIVALLRKEKDRFQNPIGYSLEAAVDALFELVQGVSMERAQQTVDDAVRIMAVQPCPPSQALSFIRLFKEAVRDELSGGEDAADLPLVEARLDEIMMGAFDFYVECRERINRVRTGEVKAAHERLSRLLGSMMGSHAAEGEGLEAVDEETGR